jgi:hypothetical protein
MNEKEKITNAQNIEEQEKLKLKNDNYAELFYLAGFRREVKVVVIVTSSFFNFGFSNLI